MCLCPTKVKRLANAISCRHLVESVRKRLRRERKNDKIVVNVTCKVKRREGG